MAKALERYVKKSKKWSGPDGVKMKGQYAKLSGKKVVDDDTADDEMSDPGKAAAVASQGKKKKRSYLSE